MSTKLLETRIAEIDTLCLVEFHDGSRSIVRFSPQYGPATKWGVSEKQLVHGSEPSWDTLGEPVEWLTRVEVENRFGEQVAQIVHWENP